MDLHSTPYLPKSDTSSIEYHNSLTVRPPTSEHKFVPVSSSPQKLTTSSTFQTPVTTHQIALVGQNPNLALQMANKRLTEINQKIIDIEKKLELINPEEQNTKSYGRCLKATLDTYKQAQNAINKVAAIHQPPSLEEESSALVVSQSSVSNYKEEKNKELAQSVLFNTFNECLVLAKKQEEYTAVREKLSNSPNNKAELEYQEIKLTQEIQVHKQAIDCFSKAQKNLEGEASNYRAAQCWNNAGLSYKQTILDSASQNISSGLRRLRAEIATQQKEAGEYLSKAATCFSDPNPEEQEKGSILEQLGNIAKKYVVLLSREPSFEISSKKIKTASGTILEVPEKEFYNKYPTLKEAKAILINLEKKPEPHPLKREALFQTVTILQKIADLEAQIKVYEKDDPALANYFKNISYLYGCSLKEVKKVVINSNELPEGVQSTNRDKEIFYTQKAKESEMLVISLEQNPTERDIAFKTMEMAVLAHKKGLEKHAITVLDKGLEGPSKKILTVLDTLSKIMNTSPFEEKLKEAIQNRKIYQVEILKKALFVSDLFIEHAATSKIEDVIKQSSEFLTMIEDLENAAEKASTIPSVNIQTEEKVAEYINQYLTQVINNISTDTDTKIESSTHLLSQELEKLVNFLSFLEKPLQEMAIPSLKEDLANAERHGNTYQATLLRNGVLAFRSFINKALNNSTREGALKNSAEFTKIINIFKMAASECFFGNFDRAKELEIQGMAAMQKIQET